MAGLQVDATWESGALWAWFSAGAALVDLQFSAFPGFGDAVIARPLVKQEPVESIVFFDGMPACAAA